MIFSRVTLVFWLNTLYSGFDSLESSRNMSIFPTLLNSLSKQCVLHETKEVISCLKVTCLLESAAHGRISHGHSIKSLLISRLQLQIERCDAAKSMVDFLCFPYSKNIFLLCHSNVIQMCQLLTVVFLRNNLSRLQ